LMHAIWMVRDLSRNLKSTPGFSSHYLRSLELSNHPALFSPAQGPQTGTPGSGIEIVSILKTAVSPLQNQMKDSQVGKDMRNGDGDGA
jgi:hypothetical protein